MNKPLAKGLLSAIAERVLGRALFQGRAARGYVPPALDIRAGAVPAGLLHCRGGLRRGNSIVAAAIAALVCFILAAAAMLCWKNQSARMLSDDEFEYKTFLGNTRRYSFSQITQLKQNPDSCTLFVGKEKIHIETCAILTDRFIERINRQLSENG